MPETLHPTPLRIRLFTARGQVPFSPRFEHISSVFSLNSPCRTRPGQPNRVLKLIFPRNEQRVVSYSVVVVFHDPVPLLSETVLFFRILATPSVEALARRGSPVRAT